MELHRLSGDLREKLLAGKAVVTLRHTGSGNHLTYRIKQCHDNPSLYFVGVLTGPDNTSHYSYLGCIRIQAEYDTHGSYYHGRKSRIAPDAPSATVFRNVWQRLDKLPPTIEVYHSGHCLRCGRELTVPESIDTGFGPECTKIIHKAA